MTTEIATIGSKAGDSQLVWGDNLPIMRMMPDASIDMIYIDPPFFSGRKYQCIFGDSDEARSFNDIWDGGLPTYLAWLNARLWEMKRLLKPSASICVHLDWHAVHYVKAEMDKIFGYKCFRNEIIWSYSGWNKHLKGKFERRHDNILLYAREANPDHQKWNKIGEPWASEAEYVKVRKQKVRVDEDGRKFVLSDAGGDKRVERFLDEAMADGRPLDDVWRIDKLNNSDAERIGYPTQKPEAVIAKLIKCMSSEGDVVADFFAGGGTTCMVAEKLHRRWFGVDISRVAVALTRDRLVKTFGVPSDNERKSRSRITVMAHGSYEKESLSKLTTAAYSQFVLHCYGASVTEHKSGLIDGDKGSVGVCVAPFGKRVRPDLVEAFEQELAVSDYKSGAILCWGYTKESEAYAKRCQKEGLGIILVEISLIDIESPIFTNNNIRFLNYPAVIIKHKQLGEREWLFDGSASVGTNGVDIVQIQWDFNYDEIFTPSAMCKYCEKGEGPEALPTSVHHRFEAPGRYKVALRIIDRLGAEALKVVDITVNR